VLYANVCRITSGTKREELQVLIKIENVDVVGITETWDKVDILDSDMEIPGFKLFREDPAAVNDKLECGPMPNVMVALPNIGGDLCSTPQSLADAHY